MPTPRSCTRTQTVSGAGAATATVTLHLAARVLHGVVEQVGDDGAQLLGVAADRSARDRVVRLERDGAGCR